MTQSSELIGRKNFYGETKRKTKTTEWANKSAHQMTNAENKKIK